MLEAIKEEIEAAKNDSTPFCDFYQQYVMSMQDLLIESEIKSFSNKAEGVTGVKSVIAGVNILVEEFNKL